MASQYPKTATLPAHVPAEASQMRKRTEPRSGAPHVTTLNEPPWPSYSPVNGPSWKRTARGAAPVGDEYATRKVPSASEVMLVAPPVKMDLWDTESYPSAKKVAEAVSVPIVTSPEPYCEKR